jgi:hypothetical protein
MHLDVEPSGRPGAGPEAGSMSGGDRLDDGKAESVPAPDAWCGRG